MKKLDKNDQWLVEQIKNSLFNQDAMARYLSEKGYVSKSGLPLTGAHISNFMRKDLGMRRVPPYEKPNYKGMNHVTVKQIKKEGKWAVYHDARYSGNLAKVQGLLEAIGMRYTYSNCEEEPFEIQGPEQQIVAPALHGRFNDMILTIYLELNQRTDPTAERLRNFVDKCVTLVRDGKALSTDQFKGLVNIYVIADREVR